MNQSAPSAHPGNSAQANPRMTPVRGLLVLVAVLVFVTTYLILSHAMGLTESWSGFLFLVCWAVSHMVSSNYPAVPSALSSARSPRTLCRGCRQCSEW